jgi:excisionase family DNA binding protein
MEKQKRLMTIREAAAYLGLSVHTLYNGIARNTAKPFPIKPIRIGSKPLFDVRDLDAFIEAQKAGATA